MTNRRPGPDNRKKPNINKLKFDQLSETEALALKLIVFEELSLREAATKLGIEYPAIQARMNRIRTRFGLGSMKSERIGYALRVQFGLEDPSDHAKGSLQNRAGAKTVYCKPCGTYYDARLGCIADE